jgi:hypothetical protein
MPRTRAWWWALPAVLVLAGCGSVMAASALARLPRAVTGNAAQRCALGASGDRRELPRLASRCGAIRLGIDRGRPHHVGDRVRPSAVDRWQCAQSAPAGHPQSVQLAVLPGSLIVGVFGDHGHTGSFRLLHSNDRGSRWQTRPVSLQGSPATATRRSSRGRPPPPSCCAMPTGPGAAATSVCCARPTADRPGARCPERPSPAQLTPAGSRAQSPLRSPPVPRTGCGCRATTISRSATTAAGAGARCAASIRRDPRPSSTSLMDPTRGSWVSAAG